MADNFNINVSTTVNLNELKSLLVELQAINAEIAKLGTQNLNAITNSTRELTASINKTSTATKEVVDSLSQTKNSFDNLPKSIKESSDSIIDYHENVRKLEEETKNTTSVVTGFYMELGAAASRLAMQMPSAIMASIKAFGEQEMAIQKLSSAIRSNGGSVSEVLPIFQEFASEIQRITTYGDEQVLAMQAMASSMGVNSDQMQECIQGAIGLTQAYGMGTTEAIKAAAFAIQGKTEKLNELIPSLSKCKTEEEKLALANKAMRDGFAQAKAEVDTTNGKLKQAVNAWGDLAEVAGSTFAPIAKDVASLLKAICEVFNENEIITRILTGGLASLALGFAFTKIGGLVTVIKSFIGLGSAIKTADVATKGLNASLKVSPIGLVVAAISALAMGWSYVTEKREEARKKNIEAVRDEISGIDAEIAKLKQWGLTLEANKQKTAEVQAEIAKLEKEKSGMGETVTQQNVFGFVRYTSYSPEEQKRVDQINALLEQKKKLLDELRPSEELAKKESEQRAKVEERVTAVLQRRAEAEYALSSSTAALSVAKEKLLDIEESIAEIENGLNSGEIGTSEKEASVNRLVNLDSKRLEILKEIEGIESKLSADKKAEEDARIQKVGLDLERQILQARSSGNTAEEKRLSSIKEKYDYNVKSRNLQEEYLNKVSATLKSENDIVKAKSDAVKYAEAVLSAEQSSKEAEEYNANLSVKSKQEQRSLEFDILKARASGNEAQAKDLEGKLRISQLTQEIFEANRKEGMSKKELESLQAIATNQAQERYNLERSIAEEAERQNMAKNAQAQIEDILLQNKIEQLKAEGKHVEAKELEREREINRRLDALGNTVSDEEKENLRKTMRQTNDLRDKQEKRSSFTKDSTSESRARASQSEREFASSIGIDRGSDGGTSSRRSRRIPATVSRKNEGFYAEWKVAGGSKSGENWTAYRKRRSAEVEAQNNAETSDKKNIRVNSQNILNKNKEDSKRIANSNIKANGVLGDVSKNISTINPRNLPTEEKKKDEENQNNPPKPPKAVQPSILNQKNNQNQNFGGNKVVSLLASIDKTVKSLASS